MGNTNRHVGTSLDEFLESEGQLVQAAKVASSRVVAFKLEQRRLELGLSIAELARAMGTSRSVVHNMLDTTNDSKNLTTLCRAAAALDARIVMDLETA